MARIVNKNNTGADSRNNGINNDCQRNLEGIIEKLKSEICDLEVKYKEAESRCSSLTSSLHKKEQAVMQQQGMIWRYEKEFIKNQNKDLTFLKNSKFIVEQYKQLGNEMMKFANFIGSTAKDIGSTAKDICSKVKDVESVYEMLMSDRKQSTEDMSNIPTVPLWSCAFGNCSEHITGCSYLRPPYLPQDNTRSPSRMRKRFMNRDLLSDLLSSASCSAYNDLCLRSDISPNFTSPDSPVDSEIQTNSRHVSPSTSVPDRRKSTISQSPSKRSRSSSATTPQNSNQSVTSAVAAKVGRPRKRSVKRPETSDSQLLKPLKRKKSLKVRKEGGDHKADGKEKLNKSNPRKIPLSRSRKTVSKENKSRNQPQLSDEEHEVYKISSTKFLAGMNPKVVLKDVLLNTEEKDNPYVTQLKKQLSEIKNGMTNVNNEENLSGRSQDEENSGGNEEKLDKRSEVGNLSAISDTEETFDGTSEAINMGDSCEVEITNDIPHLKEKFDTISEAEETRGSSVAKENLTDTTGAEEHLDGTSDGNEYLDSISQVDENMCCTFESEEKMDCSSEPEEQISGTSESEKKMNSTSDVEEEMSGTFEPEENSGDNFVAEDNDTEGILSDCNQSVSDSDRTTEEGFSSSPVSLPATEDLETNNIIVLNSMNNDYNAECARNSHAYSFVPSLKEFRVYFCRKSRAPFRCKRGAHTPPYPSLKDYQSPPSPPPRRGPKTPPGLPPSDAEDSDSDDDDSGSYGREDYSRTIHEIRSPSPTS